VIGEANNGGSAYAVWGRSNSGFAGVFHGDVMINPSFDGSKKGDLTVTGTIIKGGGGFRASILKLRGGIHYGSDSLSRRHRRSPG
jgi:hypothetical protein